MRTPELLMCLAKEHSGLARQLAGRRPVLRFALEGNLGKLDAGLVLEEKRERARDKLYWTPLRKQLEIIRHGIVDMRRVSGASDARNR
jgi:hypothetical protein